MLLHNYKERFNSCNSVKQHSVTHLFSYSPIHLFTSKRKAVAFTLAEVLITLGIIGVVAAITIPTLIQNHRKQVVESKLQKFYSEINQVILKAEMDHGDKIDWHIQNVDDLWNIYLAPYLNYANVKISGSSKYIYLADGTAFRIDIWRGTEGGHFEFYPNAKDVGRTLSSSEKGVGVNSFMFGFWPSGTGVYKYHYGKGIEPYLANWFGNENDFKNHSIYGCNVSASQRQYCTILIQKNGWKIPKDYPFKF